MRRLEKHPAERHPLGPVDTNLLHCLFPGQIDVSLVIHHPVKELGIDPAPWKERVLSWEDSAHCRCDSRHMQCPGFAS